jgi:hypothetical protein
MHAHQYFGWIWFSEFFKSLLFHLFLERFNFLRGLSDKFRRWNNHQYLYMLLNLLADSDSLDSSNRAALMARHLWVGLNVVGHWRHYCGFTIVWVASEKIQGLSMFWVSSENIVKRRKSVWNNWEPHNALRRPTKYCEWNLNALRWRSVEMMPRSAHQTRSRCSAYNYWNSWKFTRNYIRFPNSALFASSSNEYSN